MFLEVFKKCLNYGDMNLEMQKKIELQHHLIFFLKTHWTWIVKMNFHPPFWSSVVCIYLGDKVLKCVIYR
jgi:hypothetical protein